MQGYKPRFSSTPISKVETFSKYSLDNMWSRFHYLRSSIVYRKQSDAQDASTCAELIAFYIELKFECMHSRRMRKLMATVERMIDGFIGATK